MDIDDLKDKHDELIEKSEELLNLHNDINKAIDNEVLKEESHKDVISEINNELNEELDKKNEINDVTNDLRINESIINDYIDERVKNITSILSLRQDEIDTLNHTIRRQEELCGITSQILTNIKDTLDAQQQLNNAFSSGATLLGGTSPSKKKHDDDDIDDDVSRERKNNKWYNKGNLAKSVFDGSVDLVTTYGKKGIDKWIEIDKHVYTTGRQMGMTASQMRGMQKNILENYGEMANRLGMTFEEIFKFQEGYQKSVGRSVVLTNKQVESLAGLSKMVGETAIADMSKNMDDFGASSQTAIDYLTLNMARAANQGLNLQETSEKFAKNISLASRLTFSKGVDGISKMTLLSQRLKFNMESIANSIDKFSTIEGAISTSANLQVLGGAYAANFSNPMQVMGEALLDAEGFTQRIIDTVSQNAVFNKEKGMVEMSPIEKAKLREASKNLNIDYNELWGMASQSAKKREIDSKLLGKNFSEEQRLFLANTAQYDTKTNAWTVQYMNSEGKQESVDITELTDKQLEEIQKQSDVDKSIQGDVHSIRNKLDSYLGQTVGETKTFEEAFKGQKERLSINIASFLDPVMMPAKGALNAMSAELFVIGGLVWRILRFLTKNGVSEISNSLGRMGRRKSAKGKIGGSVAKGGSSIMKHGFKRGLTRTGLKLFGRGGLKAVSKAVPIAGTVLAVGEGVYDGYQAISQHKERVKRIEADTTLSKEEKKKALYESRKEKNKGLGGAIGGTSGTLVGMGIGMAVGGPIGAAIGGLIGWGVGKLSGNAIGEAVTKEEDDEKAKPKVSEDEKAKEKIMTNTLIVGSAELGSINLASPSTNKELVDSLSDKAKPKALNNTEVDSIMNNDTIKNKEVSNRDLLSMIHNDVKDIRIGITGKDYDTVSHIVPKNQYDTKTYIREYVPTQVSNMYSQNNSNNKIDVNINGTIKIQGVGKTQDLDLTEVFQSPEFQRMIISKINEGFAKNGNIVQTRSLDTTQAIIGGFYSPKQLNSI